MDKEQKILNLLFELTKKHSKNRIKAIEQKLGQLGASGRIEKA